MNRFATLVHFCQLPFIGDTHGSSYCLSAVQLRPLQDQELQNDDDTQYAS